MSGSLHYSGPVAITRTTIGISLAAAVAGVIVGAAVTLLSLPDAGNWAFWVGVSLLTVLGIALIWWFARRQEQMTPLPLLTAFFLIEFVLGGIFYRLPRPDSVLLGLEESYTEASMQTVPLLVLAAWLAIVVGYSLSEPVGALASRLPRPAVEPSHLVLVALILWAIGLLARVQMVRSGYYFHFDADAGTAAGSGTFRQFVTIGANLPLIATALLACAFFQGLVRRGWLVTVVALEVAWALPSGERSRLIILAFALIVTRYYSTTKRFPVQAALATGAAAVFVIFPAGAIYRGAEAGGGGSSDFQTSPAANAERTVRVFSSQPLTETIEMGLEETGRRFSGSTAIAALNRYGTSRYPTEPEDAIMSWLGAVVPRTLLPEKANPSLVTNEFGRRYNQLLPTVKNSSVAVTIPGDLYGTFGFAGMIVWLLVVGAVVRGVAGYFSNLRSSPTMLAVYAGSIGSLLLGFETTVSVGLLQALREMIVYLVAVWASIAIARTIAHTPRTARPSSQAHPARAG